MNHFKRFLLTASVTLAMAFTVSCSSDDDDGGGDNNGGGGGGNSVTIGTQTWMAKNLNIDVLGSKCYDNQESNCDKYGRLYDWATAMDLDASCNSTSCSSQINAKHRGVCPAGWHIPSDAEWTTLTTFVGESAGKKLKATSGWNRDGNGDNSTAFAALPGGSGLVDGDGNSTGSFGNVGNYGNWWSASEIGRIGAFNRNMSFAGGSVSSYHSSKGTLFSVRCVQD